jgi:hypothetical protein
MSAKVGGCGVRATKAEIEGQGWRGCALERLVPGEAEHHSPVYFGARQPLKSRTGEYYARAYACVAMSRRGKGENRRILSSVAHRSNATFSVCSFARARAPPPIKCAEHARAGGSEGEGGKGEEREREREEREERERTRSQGKL